MYHDWNSGSLGLIFFRLVRDPVRVSAAYTPDSTWRNRDTFLKGTDAIVAFLTAKWNKEKSYRLRKELFAFTENRIAVQFWYEYQDSSDGMKWKRCYGLEDWTFDYATGKMRKRQMSGNDIVLGSNGDGEGRWFAEGADVEDAEITEEHWWSMK
jgi:nuclear transport factor 2 (NTF2) superfamily protein